MLPLLAFIGAGVATILIGVLATETGKNSNEFTDENIVHEFAKSFKADEETKAKIHATKLINKLIKGQKEFKLGKTGSPSDRIKQHIGFEKIYLIIKSDDQDFIEKLESIYNEKFFSHTKNRNWKIGSAGKMTDKTGYYFLYLVANQEQKKK